MKSLIESQVPRGYMSMSDGTNGGFMDSARSQVIAIIKSGNKISEHPIVLYIDPVTGKAYTERPRFACAQRFRMCINQEWWAKHKDGMLSKYKSGQRPRVVPLRPVPTPTGPMTLTDAEARLFIAYLRDTANAIEARLG